MMLTSDICAASMFCSAESPAHMAASKLQGLEELVRRRTGRRPATS